MDWSDWIWLGKCFLQCEELAIPTRNNFKLCMGNSLRNSTGKKRICIKEQTRNIRKKVKRWNRYSNIFDLMDSWDILKIKGWSWPWRIGHWIVLGSLGSHTSSSKTVTSSLRIALGLSSNVVKIIEMYFVDCINYIINAFIMWCFRHLSPGSSFTASVSPVTDSVELKLLSSSYKQTEILEREVGVEKQTTKTDVLNSMKWK